MGSPELSAGIERRERFAICGVEPGRPRIPPAGTACDTVVNGRAQIQGLKPAMAGNWARICRFEMNKVTLYSKSGRARKLDEVPALEAESTTESPPTVAPAEPAAKATPRLREPGRLRK